ncbi:major facilitator superfamily domain-containing protein [Aspergillus undulatus]|uniref:major facilitator superfamily domain-containing protein n=1 Tax=Aspergillus undulatus TaxID=1810928 RepID=UPI003CCD8B6D
MEASSRTKTNRDTAAREEKILEGIPRPSSGHRVCGKVENTNMGYLRCLELNEHCSGKRLPKLAGKVDWHVLPQLILINLMSYIGRTNAGNARLFGVGPDLRLSGQRWNTCLSIFFVTYALGGVPSNIALKRFEPKIWLPALLFSVAAILVFTSLLVNFGGWAAFRVLLGVFEAGIFRAVPSS